ncbi:DUF4249 domain-containing protein [uncultured Algoriphagus sp.]|uniref:DUF4249 domain-containing protein n=1 Tax=uncultured Algoriphagus sp. TaxID=417365 RepID=UPI0030EEDEE2|tara:strand:+ start:33901 stop:35037 length:1137 start_codon:yes stop_codon:yes gene_type:complete
MSRQLSVISYQFSEFKARLIVFGIFVILVLMIGSCVEKIDFPLDKGKAKLVVSGQISNLSEHKYVFLSETTSSDREPILSGNYYVLNDLPRPVSGAVVLVSDLGDNWSYLEVQPGKYRLDSSVKIQDGVLYHLEISVKGRKYISEPEMLPTVVGEDELGYTFNRGVFNNNPEIAYISINTDVSLPEQNGGYYLRWDVDEAYFWDLTFFPNPFNQPPPDCYVFGFPDPERITLLSGDLVGELSGSLSQIVAERVIDESFLSRHYFNVRQTSITKSSYDYWRKVRDLVNNSGSVFDTPPAPIRGNIINVDDEDEVVLGNFEVARVMQSRIYTTRADIPYFEPEVCTYDKSKPYDEYPKTCLRCSEFPNSTNDTPHWWFDE